MPIRANKHALPEPTWTQSDNDLMPKWLKYLIWHSQNEGDGEVVRLKAGIANLARSIEDTADQVKYYNAEIARYKTRLDALKNALPVTDDDLRSKYDELLALPYVAGTRVGRAGELYVLVDTSKLCPQGRSLGWLEIGQDFITKGRVHFVSSDIHNLRKALDSYYYLSTDEIGDFNTLSVSLGTNESSQPHLAIGDIAKLVSSVAEELISFASQYKAYISEVPIDKHVADRPWLGFVTDPAHAIKRLQLVAGRTTVEELIRQTESCIASSTRYKKEYTDYLREYRAQLRTNQAQLAELQKSLSDVPDIDIEEARTTLEYISQLPGVIAIKFDQDGIPVIHVRNSFTYGGKRYDLGDFELYLRTESTYFGTTMKVRRTRCPAGGSYDKGWHPDADAFCFGGSSIGEILASYRRGDFGHAVNVALGIMNSLSNGDGYKVHEGRFVEIDFDAVWKRTVRKRPRRRTSARLGKLAVKVA